MIKLELTSSIFVLKILESKKISISKLNFKFEIRNEFRNKIKNSNFNLITKSIFLFDQRNRFRALSLIRIEYLNDLNGLLSK